MAFDLVEEHIQRGFEAKHRAGRMGALGGRLDITGEHGRERLVECRPDIDPVPEGATAITGVERDVFGDALAIEPAALFTVVEVEVARLAVVDPERQRVMVERDHGRQTEPPDLVEQGLVIREPVGAHVLGELVDGIGISRRLVGEEARPLDRESDSVVVELVFGAREVLRVELAHAGTIRERLAGDVGRIGARDEVRVGDPLVPVARAVLALRRRQGRAPWVALETGDGTAPEERLRKVRFGVLGRRRFVVARDEQREGEGEATHEDS